MTDMQHWYEYANHDFQFADRMVKEARLARLKFPGGKQLLGALMEEVGEVAKALLKIQEAGDSPQCVYDELVQAAAMCLRLATEGEPEYGYEGVKCHHMGCRGPALRPPCELCYE